MPPYNQQRQALAGNLGEFMLTSGMKHLFALVFLFALSPLATAQEHNKTQNKAQDCYCTDKSGQRVELGEVTCLRVDGRAFSARCEMSLNNPMWREQEGGCLSS